MIDVSVIVPVYNVAPLMSASIASITAQTHKNIEIILVDDESSDGSSEICDSLAKQDARIRVIHKKHEGTGFARNAGMDAASGEYLYFCDPDDMLDANLIEDNYTLAKENDADLVEFGHKIVMSKENGAPRDRIDTVLPHLAGVYGRDEYWANFRKAGITGMVWNRLFRRSLVESGGIRHTNLSNGQDTYFVYDVYSLNFNKIVFNQKPYYMYIKRKGASTTIFKPQRAQNEYRISLRFEDMIKSLNAYDGAYDDIIASKYLWVMSKAIENLAKSGGNLTHAQKIDIIKNTAQMPRVAQTIKTVRISSLKSAGTAALVVLMRLRLYSSALALKGLKFKLKEDVK